MNSEKAYVKQSENPPKIIVTSSQMESITQKKQKNTKL